MRSGPEVGGEYSDLASRLTHILTLHTDSGLEEDVGRMKGSYLGRTRSGQDVGIKENVVSERVPVKIRSFSLIAGRMRDPGSRRSSVCGDPVINLLCSVMLTFGAPAGRAAASYVTRVARFPSSPGMGYCIPQTYSRLSF